MMSADNTLTEKEIFKLLTAGESPLVKGSDFDDAATVKLPDGGQLVIASDFIRGPQFNLAEAGHLSFTDLAHYLVAANASDISAMGVRPCGFLDVFRYPPGTAAEIQQEFFHGLKSAAQHYEVEIVGGDSGGYSTFVLSGTCFGFAAANQPVLRRSGAKTGDLVCLVGNPGRCRAAQLAALSLPTGTVDSKIIDELLIGWRRPSPPIEFGSWLGENRLATAAMDTSDGLGSSIHDICVASNVGASIDSSLVPVLDNVEKIANLADLEPVALSLSVSPDFALLFTVNPQNLDGVCRNPFGAEVHVLGEITIDRAVGLSTKKGWRALPLEDYDHRTWNQ